MGNTQPTIAPQPGDTPRFREADQGLLATDYDDRQIKATTYEGSMRPDDFERAVRWKVSHPHL